MTWILVPAVGALIGYVTNTIAVTMLFRPHRPRRLLMWQLHGLIPKRQPDLARKIGEVVGTHLLDEKDLVQAFADIDLRPVIERVIDAAIEKKLGSLTSMPMIGAFLTPDRLKGIRDGLVDSVIEQQESLAVHIEQALENNLDIAKIVSEKVAAFPTERMEQLVLEVARRELRAIEIWGAVLGALIGIGQVILLEILT